jgi:ribosomal protein S27E
MGKTKLSPIWDKFTLSNNETVASCNQCGKSLAYKSRHGPRNLMNHLETQKCCGKDKSVRRTKSLKRSKRSKSRSKRSRRSKSRSKRSRRSKSRSKRSRKSRRSMRKSRRSMRKSRRSMRKSRRSMRKSRRSMRKSRRTNKLRKTKVLRSKRSRKTKVARRNRRSMRSRKSSPIWKKFTLSKNDTVASCNHCGKRLVYSSRAGPRNLIKHLESQKCKL